MSEPNERKTFPVLPLKNSVLFPNLAMPLSVGRPQSIAAVEAALATEDKMLVVASQTDANVEDPGPAALLRVGTQGVIKKMSRTNGGMQIIVQGGGSKPAATCRLAPCSCRGPKIGQLKPKRSSRRSSRWAGRSWSRSTRRRRRACCRC
jgi:hypothetical protein